MSRYYGLYSNAHRGKIRKAGADPSYPPIIEVDPSYVPAKGWAEMIRKVFEKDPLLCPSCGGQMRIIGHLKLTFEAERPPPPRVVQQKQYYLKFSDEWLDDEQEMLEKNVEIKEIK